MRDIRQIAEDRRYITYNIKKNNNMKIINNFEDFLNEEEELDLRNELETDFDDIDSEYDELDEDFDSEFDSELDEEFGFDFEDDFDSLDEKGSGAGTLAKGSKGAPIKGELFKKGDPHKMDKFKYKAVLAPKLIMTLATPAKMNSVLNGPMPGNIGYDKKGLKNRDFIPSMAVDFLRLVSITNPGKMDGPAYKKILDSLSRLHASKVGNKTATFEPEFKAAFYKAKAAGAKTFQYKGKMHSTATGKVVK